MEHDVYYERQRALIERSLQSEREREEIRRYHREKASRDAYFRLMRTKRHKIVRECKGRKSPKRVNTAIEHGERMTIRTKRFDNSHITICYRHKPC